MADFAAALALLDHAIADRVFPGAAFGVLHRGQILAIESAGRFTYAQDSPPVLPATRFDIASVSKVLATTAITMRLHQAGKLDLATPLVAVLPQFASDSDDDRRKSVTLAHLLTHTSGLPAYAQLWHWDSVVAAPKADGKANAALAACLQMPLERNPGLLAEYSDIGFILLGQALSAITGTPLDQLAKDLVFDPLGMASTCYTPAPQDRADIAPTCDWNMRHRVLQGEVHDENCALLGGITGHTGVFTNCEDILKFADAILRADGTFTRPTVELFSQRVSGSRALGWDTPSAPSQSGRYFSANSIGHLGFSGTSLWIDFDREIAITMLTNRCYTGAECGPLADKLAIGRVRPVFHDAVMSGLLA